MSNDFGVTTKGTAMAVMTLPSPIAYRALRPCVQAEVIDPVATAAQKDRV